MGKWTVVHRNGRGSYIEMTYFRPKIKKKKMKRKSYTTLYKIIFLHQIRNLKNFKKAAQNENIPYKTAHRWKQLYEKDKTYFMKKLKIK